MTGEFIRELMAGDIPGIVAAFSALGWNKPVAQYERYLAEQVRGEREVLVAFHHETFAGYLTVMWQPEYAPFRESGVPEIQDLNVLPHVRQRGIASRLLDMAEQRIALRSPVSGIGVGMDADYGAAQRLYVQRGYVPDGRGLTSHGRHVRWGETVTVDDDLVLYFTKRLG
jgi:GNAT superfamily N-acetyltransferase